MKSSLPGLRRIAPAPILFLAFLAFTISNSFAAENAPRDNSTTTLRDLGSGIDGDVYMFEHWRTFNIDTGADYTLVRLWFTNHLVEPVTTVTAAKPNSASAPIKFYAGPPMFFANQWMRAYVGAVDFTRLEEMTGTEVDGILGVNALRDFVVTLDLQKGAISLSTNRSLPLMGTIPLEPTNSNYAFSATIGDTTVKLAIDTGAADAITLNAEDWSKVFPKPPAHIRNRTSADFEGIVHTNIHARLPLLKIGSELYTNLPCGRAAMSNFCSFVGLGFLRQHKVTIDYPNNRLKLERLNVPAYEENMSGIALKWNRGSAIIRAIDADSPASNSGLVEGDEFLKINGQAIWKYTRKELFQLLRKGDGEVLTIEALHGANPVKAKIALRRLQ
jgi:hypothetical protein